MARKKREVRPDQHGKLGYQYGCRCAVCKKGHSVAGQIANRAKMLDSQWVRKYRPEVHESNLAEAYAYFGQELRPVGKPPDKDSWLADYNDR